MKPLNSAALSSFKYKVLQTEHLYWHSEELKQFSIANKKIIGFKSHAAYFPNQDYFGKD